MICPRGYDVLQLENASPLVLIAGMIILTMLVVQIIGGQVTALLVGPIAINAALLMNVDPRAMSVAVAMSCSMAFLTPIAHPVNILMMGPGNYTFGDFPRVGVGMTVVTLLAMLLKLIWGI
jgi:di/tricarboxylate transporter